MALTYVEFQLLFFFDWGNVMRSDRWIKGSFLIFCASLYHQLHVTGLMTIVLSDKARMYTSAEGCSPVSCGAGDFRLVGDQSCSLRLREFWINYVQKNERKKSLVINGMEL